MNEAWKTLFAGSYVCHLPKCKSDHLPLLLHIQKSIHHVEQKRKRRCFRFEQMWIREPECDSIVEGAWGGRESVIHKINRSASKLSTWSKERFGDFAKEMRKCREEMSFLMAEPQTAKILSQMQMIDSRLDELEKREEMFWHQRSKQNWIEAGDRNTKFFHGKAQQRRNKNQIRKLKDNAGATYTDEDQISAALV